MRWRHDVAFWDWKKSPPMSQTASYDAQARIGLFTCSGNTFAATSAVFENVSTSK